MEEYRNNVETTRNLYLRLFTQADFKLAKGLDLGLKFQYEDNYGNTERYDEENSYFMRNKIDTYASSDGKGGFIYNIPMGGHMSEQNSHSYFYNIRGQLNYNTTLAENTISQPSSVVKSVRINGALPEENVMDMTIRN